MVKPQFHYCIAFRHYCLDHALGAGYLNKQHCMCVEQKQLVSMNNMHVAMGIVRWLQRTPALC